MNINCIIQARMSSTRLPGKIMKFIEDKVVLQHVVDRCKMSRYIDKVIVATTNKKDDDIIEKYCIDNNILYYRGDENNVLERYYLTATTFNSDIIIRVTSDCPLIDYNIIDNMIEYFKENNLKFLQPKYSNGNNQKSRGGFPDGFNPQIFTYNALKESYEKSKTDFEKEHVGPYMVENFLEKEYNILLIKNYSKIDLYNLHLSLDTIEDYNLIKNIYNKLYIKNKNFSLYDVLDFLNIYKSK